MKLILCKLLFYIGDIISRTTMTWGNGFGYSIYTQVMLWSCNLDNEGKIWKYVNKAKKKKRK